MGLQFGQFALPEISVRKLRVGHDESRCPDNAITETHDIEIQRARPPSLTTNSPAFFFDGQARIQQDLGIQRRFEQHHLVEVWSLPYGPDRYGFFDGAFSLEFRIGERRETLAGKREVRVTIADVRSQGDEHNLTSHGLGRAR